MLKQIQYYILFSTLYTFSLLPFPVLLGIGNVLSFVLKKVIKYRNDVIQDNLEKCFPGKSETEIADIKNEFYDHFAEIIVTSVKLVSLPKRKISRYVHIENPELLEAIYENGQSVLMVSGHYGNWELLGTALYYHSQYQLQGIYRPIKSKAVDQLMLKIRGRFASKLILQQQVARTLLAQKDVKTITFLLADQSPANPDNSLWIKFLGRQTPFLNAIERLANKTGQQVVFGNMTKTGRARYSLSYELIEGNNIMEKYAALLEEQIKKAPAFYLWSHRRWKHEAKAK